MKYVAPFVEGQFIRCLFVDITGEAVRIAFERNTQGKIQGKLSGPSCSPEEVIGWNSKREFEQFNPMFLSMLKYPI